MDVMNFTARQGILAACENSDEYDIPMDFSAAAARDLSIENSNQKVKDNLAKATDLIKRACKKGLFYCVLDGVLISSSSRTEKIINKAGYTIIYTSETAPWAMICWGTGKPNT